MEADWYFRKGEKEYGPFSASALKKLVEEGRLTRECKLRRGEQGDWVPATKAKNLFKSKIDQHKRVAAAPVAEGMPSYLCGLVGAAVLFLVGILVYAVMPERPPAPKGAAVATAKESGPVDPESEELPPPKPKKAKPKPVAGRMSVEEIVAAAEPSVALVQGKWGSGTGVIVARNVIATNAHVIDDELIDSLEIHFPSAPEQDRGPHVAKLIYKDAKRDLALLSVPVKLRALKVSTLSALRRGQEAIAIGSPGIGDGKVLQNAISRGVFSTTTSLDDQEYLQFGIAINSGNSGGPILDESGSIIGIVTSKANQKEGLAFCVPPKHLREAVQASAKMNETQRAEIASRHEVEAVFGRLKMIGDVYKDSMRIYTISIELAIKNGLGIDDGISMAHSKVRDVADAVKNRAGDDIKHAISRIAKDPHLSDGVRTKFVDLWSISLELRSYVEEPRGSLVTYRQKMHDLADSQERLLNSLRLLLGIEEK